MTIEDCRGCLGEFKMKNMASIGQYNQLRIVREASPGLYLHGEELGEILLPRRYVTKTTVVGSRLEVFVYRDSEDRLVATTERPLAKVGEVAFLKVLSLNQRLGAFLDWGLSKDLLLPMRELNGPVEVGGRVVVAIFLDPINGRIVASRRLNRHLDKTLPTYAEGQRVGLLIAGETPLGFKAVINHAHWGLVYAGELAKPLSIGQEMDGYIRKVREDGKIDVGLDAAGYGRVKPLTEQIMAAMAAQGGRLSCDDQSTPEVIRQAFGTSKKAFKQAVGALYRERRIRMTKPGLELID